MPGVTEQEIALAKQMNLYQYSLEPGAAMGGREENPDSALQSFVTGINPPNCGGRNGVFSSHLPPLFLFCSHT